MFKRSELAALRKEHLVGLTHLKNPGNSATARPAKLVDALASAKELLRDELIGDVRGDVRSDAALVYQMYSARMFRLVREAIRVKLTGAAWPVWGTYMGNVRSAINEVQRRALFRMPKVYRWSVQFVVLITMTADTFIMGTVVGRLWSVHYGYELMMTILATVLLLVLVVPVTLLVAACIEMEEPFGDNVMDIPGCSNVRGVAEVTLNMVRPNPVCRDAVHAVMDVDLSHLLPGVGGDQRSRPSPKPNTPNETGSGSPYTSPFEA